jgi:hypothetical protein
MGNLAEGPRIGPKGAGIFATLGIHQYLLRASLGCKACIQAPGCRGYECRLYLSELCDRCESRRSESMKNPDSFKLEQTLRMADGSLCFSYRATNSFDAIIPGHAVYASGKLAISGNPQFAANWAKYCSGKSGDDLDTIAYSL